MGRDLRDAYCHHSKYLLKKQPNQKASQDQITPTWEKGMKKSYHTKGHKIDFRCGKEAEQQCFDTSTGNIIHVTPQKKESKKKKNRVFSIQKICAAYVVLLGNHRKTRKVTHFGQGVQERPANVNLLLPANMNATGGCIIDVHIFTMKILMQQKEQCQLGQRSISSAINICQMCKKLDVTKSYNRMWSCHPIRKNFLKKLLKTN